MAALERPINLAMNCCLCGKLKRPKDLVVDRHRKHYCVPCSITIDYCELCGSTKLDDLTIDGQLHYEDWCFQ